MSSWLQDIKGDDPITSVAHPQAQAWLRKLGRNEGWFAKVRVDTQKDITQIYDSKIYIQFVDSQGVVQEQDKHDWDLDLDLELIRAHIRAVNPEEEATRMAKILEHWLDRVEKTFGREWFDCVMYDYMEQKQMFHPDVSEELFAIKAKVKQRTPFPGKKYEVCKDSIDQSLKVIIHCLEFNLGYAEEEVSRILLKAVYLYLYDHHNLKLRSLWGF